LTLIILLATVIAAPAAPVEVRWNANIETDLAGYRVYYGPATEEYGEPVDVGLDTSLIINLTPEMATTYYFAVTAYDTSGNESEFSEEKSILVFDDNAPDKPTGIRAIIQAIISWFRGLFGLGVRIA